MQNLYSLLVLASAYLLGSLSFAVIVSRLMGLPDPRGVGSGNPGATNMLRSGRKGAALLTLAGDLAKGWAAVALAVQATPKLELAPWVVEGAVLAVFLGHVFPLFFGFRGGKGVATALGALLALDWRIAEAVLLVLLAVFAAARISSLAALAAAALAPLCAAWLGGGAYVPALVLLALLVFWRHGANIRRLLAGEEKRFGKSRP